MYDNCGKKSVFGGSIPCVNNTKAKTPTKRASELLHVICGSEFDTTSGVCCSEDQLLNLESNLKKAEPLISSCPACRKNFYDFFCKFTCSPDQATFVDVLKTSSAIDTKKEIVSELSIFVDNTTAGRFFDSCKNIKFSATNGYAMDLIGGGAKNYLQFLKFLGDEKPLLGGSPFQINFEYDLSEKQRKSGLVFDVIPMNSCNDSVYKCACSDCPSACPKLPPFHPFTRTCVIFGKLPCFSFVVMIFWAVLILALGLYHVQLVRTKRKKWQSLSEMGENDNPLAHIHDDDDDETEDLPLVTSHCSGSHKDSRFKEQLISFRNDVIHNLQTGFDKLGYFCANEPLKTISVALFICIICCFGLLSLEWETDPVKLWVSPNEPALHNAQYFEATFGEWFRVEQIFVASKNNSESILTWENVQWWFEKEQQLNQLQNGNDLLPLEEFCFKPLGETCAIESFTQYFNGDIRYISPDSWQRDLLSCTNSPVNCLPSFQQPLKKNILFSDDDVLNSRAFVVTLLLNKYLDNSAYTERVVQYEHLLQKWIQELQHERPDLDISFSTEISLEEELNKSTNTDAKVVAISYLVMFLYASIALGGKLPASLSWRTFVETRFLLGISGIIIILLSVASAAGIFAFLGVKSTLIIAEVIPFLVLAIGVDNIFLIVHKLRVESEISPETDIADRIAASLGKIGPSCLLSACLQVSMFLLAATVQMPAVRNFALYSAGAVLINFLLQMTAFISILSLDQQRLEQGKLDLFPWITVGRISLDDSENNGENYIEYEFSTFFREKFAPWLLKPLTKKKILSAFILWLGVSLSLLPNIELGLDQKLALPQGSYLIDYFNSVYEYLNVGPPAFFVLRDVDVTKRNHQQSICGKFSTCDEFSVANILEQEYKRSHKSTIAEPASNWLDDFFNWLNPQLDQCCRLKQGSPDEFCTPFAPSRQCKPCYEERNPPYNILMEGLPENEEFMRFFNQWITEPSDPCPLGGKAPYSSSINYTQDVIKGSYLRTSHTPLRSQKDFIEAYENLRRVVEEIKNLQNDSIDIFAYSPFYVFFVQYGSIVKTTIATIAIAMAIIFTVSSLLLGLFRVALILTTVTAMVLVNIGGIMAVWGISLNAVSLVNLVICLGLAVEFTVHIAKGYLDAREEDDEEQLYNLFMDTGGVADARANAVYRTLSLVGAAVVEGITMTKLIGISVLAFTQSQIFEVYYFRMWLSLVVVASVHALVLLPVILAF